MSSSVTGAHALALTIVATCLIFPLRAAADPREPPAELDGGLKPPPQAVVGSDERDFHGAGEPSAPVQIDTKLLPPAAPPSDLTLLASPGVVVYEVGPRALVGLSLLYRSGLFAVGGFAEVGGFYPELLSGGAVAGLAVRTDGGFRAELLGTGGVRRYWGWGGVLLIDATNEGGSATLPFLGACLRLGYVFSRTRRGHFNLGGLVSVDSDLWRTRRNWAHCIYEDCTQETARVGGTRWVLGATVGVTFDLGP